MRLHLLLKKQPPNKAKSKRIENTLLGTGTGLVAVGGIGAGVIAHNNKKPKNVPTKEIDNTYDENKEKKDKNK